MQTKKNKTITVTKISAKSKKKKEKIISQSKRTEIYKEITSLLNNFNNLSPLVSNRINNVFFP